MKSQTSTVAVLLLLGACPLEAAKPSGPVPAPLRLVGETTVFAFKTNGGKMAALCRGPKGAYLVYRFGTAAKVELQYPAKLDASSWKKFTYWSYHRGNPYLAITQLKFENQGVEYTLSDHTSALYDKKHEEIYPRAVNIIVTVKGKEMPVVGNSDTAVGELVAASHDHKVKLEEGMVEDSE